MTNFYRYNSVTQLRMAKISATVNGLKFSVNIGGEEKKEKKKKIRKVKDHYI